MKFGYLGGTFDPVHHGHLIAAQDALEQLGLDTLTFVPAARSPLRAETARAEAHHRIEMLRLAIGQDDRFQVSEIEVTRGGTSYTIDTVLALRQTHPETTPIWILGEDQVAKLPDWRRIDELVRLAEFAFLERPGNNRTAAPRIPGLTLHRLHSHQVEISSTEIRQRVREKRPLRFLLPDPVINYIHEQNLYH